jgi:hypothetical protein
MKTKLLLSCLALTALAVLLAGCLLPRSAATPSAGRPVLRLLAYINVSSGCQQATVDLLNSFPTKYPGVAVELVDFGDGGEGTRRWEAAGLRCMTLQLNGHAIVKYPVNGAEKIMAFQMPAGFYWTHEDLEQAVQAALAGKLQPATEEEWEQTAPAAPSPEQMKQQQEKAKQAPGGKS